MNRKKSVQKYMLILTLAIILVSNIVIMPTTVQAQSYPVPQLIGPSGPVTTNQPTFLWVASTHPGATAYDLRMLYPNGDITQDRYTLTQIITEGKNLRLNTGITFPPGEYLWKIRYRLWGETYSDYSQPMAFNVPAVSPNAPTQLPQTTATSAAPTATLAAPSATVAPQIPQAPTNGAYYVATNGNDSNPGSESAPWRNIQSAVNRLSAGQTLYVRAGTYTETVNITVSGASGSPIKIMAYPGETPVIDGNNYQLPAGEWAAMLKVSGNYIQMSGFEVRNTNWMAVVITGANNVVSGFNVHHNKENGILITGNDDIVENSSVWMNCLSNENGSRTRGGWASGLSAARYPNNAIIRNNKVYQNWGEGLSTYEANGTIIEGNIVYDNYATNTYISDSTNVLMQGNFIYATAGSPVNSGARTGIMMGDERYAPASSNIRILNNIVVGAYRNFYWWQGTKGGGMNNVLIANNTFVNSRSTTNFQISDGTHQNVRVMNNIISQEDSLSIALVYGAGITLSNNIWSKSPGSAALGSNSVVADPILAKSGSQTGCDWFHLTASSPAINRGVNLTEVTVDHDREARSGTTDMGADEFQGQPSVPNPTAVPPTATLPVNPTATAVVPTTVAPTTVAPTTVAPTTVAPTTVAPTTVAPTTVAPTAIPVNPIPVSPVQSGGVNLALNKPASQSSNFGTNPSLGTARLGVDGNTNGVYDAGSTTHTNNQVQSWWQVDLGSVQPISKISVWNRADCCSVRLSNFYVLVSDTPFASTGLDATRSQAGVGVFPVSGQGGTPTTIDINRTGRYIRIQLSGTNYLSLAEVQVWNGVGSAPQPTKIAPTTTSVVPTTQPTNVPTSVPTQAPSQSAPVSGAYYVATNGSDSNSGTQSAPWRTIQYAANRLSAGQTLYVRAGLYQETITISRSGTAASPIKIMAYPGETPVIDGNNYQLPSTTWAAMLKLSGNYIQMSGFEVRYTNWMAVVITGANNVVSGFNVHHNKENGILITGNSDIVENSSVWMNCLSNENGIQTRQGWASGLSAARYPNNAIIRNNKVYQNWGEGLSTYESNGTIIEGNIVYDNYATNVYISDATNVLVQRNIIYATAGSSVNKGARSGIMMGDERYAPASSNIRIINNIVFGTYRNFHWWQGTKGGGMNNVLIANNTFVNSRSTTNFQISNGTHQNVRVMNNIISQEDSLSIALIYGSGITLSNNLWSKTPGATALGSSSLVGDPRFSKVGSQTSYDWYKLLSGSPATDKGLALTEVTEDCTRYRRAGTLDMGAYEYR